MKKGKKAVFTAIAAAAVLVACGSRTSETVSSGEMVVPEMSSEDLLVSSLEYLLLEDKEEEGQDLKEQHKEQENTGISGETEALAADTGQAQGETVVIYYGKGGVSGLIEETVTLSEKTADELIGALAKHNIMSLDTKVLSFEERMEDDRKVLYLDLSKAAGEYLRTMSREAECIIIASIADTFLENYQADVIYLTVEGKSLIVSNTEYVEAIGRCTPEELMNLSSAPSEDTTGEKSPSTEEEQ